MTLELRDSDWNRSSVTRSRGKKRSGLRRAHILLVLIFLFFISPKVDLISLGGSGIRAEDIILLIAFSISFFGSTWRSVQRPKYLYVYLAYIGVCCVSTVVNFDEVGFIGFVYTARQFQYVLWFVVAAEMAPNIKFKSFQSSIDLLAIALFLWWAAEAAGLLPSIGKFTSADNRISLNTSGPYELSVLVVIMMFFCSNFLLRVGLLGVLLATQARITLVAALFVYAITRPARAILYGAFAAIAFYIYLSMDFQIGATRIGDSSSATDMLTVLQRSWEHSWTISSLQEYFDTTYLNLPRMLRFDTDVSFEIRTVRWSFIVRAWLSDVEHFLLGWGPGAWSVAVDGNYVRIVGETGAIGLLTFFWFIWSAVSGKNYKTEIGKSMIVIAIACVFIDVAVASKIMSFFWIIAGMTSAGFDHDAIPAPNKVSNSAKPPVGGRHL